VVRECIYFTRLLWRKPKASFIGILSFV